MSADFSLNAIELGISAVTTLTAIGIAWGYMRSHIDSFNDRINKLEEFQEKAEDKFVTMPHFMAIIEPIQAQMTEIRADIKSILRLLSVAAHGRRKSQDE